MVSCVEQTLVWKWKVSSWKSYHKHLESVKFETITLSLASQMDSEKYWHSLHPKS